MEPEKILHALEHRTSFIKKTVMVFGPLAVGIGAYFWYMNNIWKPKVTLQTVDYEKLAATLTVNGKSRVLYAGSVVSAKYGWGIRFAGSQTDQYDRIELIKNEMSVKTLDTKNNSIT